MQKITVTLFVILFAFSNVFLQKG